MSSLWHIDEAAFFNETTSQLKGQKRLYCEKAIESVGSVSIYFYTHYPKQSSVPLVSCIMIKQNKHGLGIIVMTTGSRGKMSATYE